MRLNSYDDFTPLKEIVLGSADGYRDRVRDMSFDMFISDNLSGARGYYPSLSTWRDSEERRHRNDPDRLALRSRFLDEMIEDVEGIADRLTEHGITVHRPLPLPPGLTAVATPSFGAAVTPPLNLRDNTLILGDEIIETPPTLRDRYFETQFLKPVFLDYFRAGARWTTMPRPMMTDHSFDPANVDIAAPNIEAPLQPRDSPLDVGLEPMIDGANCLRLGRDLIVNVSNPNHALAFDWLERHLDGRFRVHRMEKLTQSHIDSVVVPLRPGTLLLRDAGVLDYLPEALRGWDVVVPPPPGIDDYPQYENDDPIPASPYIDLNVLSLDEDTVMVNDACKTLVATLEQHGFTVVPVRHRHRRLFGGGFHCFTLDTVRTGGAEDYLA
ncbi:MULTISPECIES: glycine amidinotransferase [Streptomyces]|uniref:Glycine amidinotransferase n=1 Tax=Streptomyces doudnae TaxID=3075536 RepID=A0ABD5F2K9_9ACTN|nr:MULTISPECIES: glycine amidinotransferase [unclassified Streptomyces]MDT0440124.1 glycine amidinotransferase [Streptomyces sp. DSM 41981]MYQ69436.1 glycine amidinotransferase [Streptomyces sp. SID4950]SCE53516.1 glycine amidinotransferase [Streptomyces sp. SolWspMP-5a-2]